MLLVYRTLVLRSKNIYPKTNFCLRSWPQWCRITFVVALSTPVYTIQPVVTPVVKPVWQPVKCLYTRCQTHLTTRCIVYTNIQPVWQPAVSCIQPVVKPVVLSGLTTGWRNCGCSFNTVVKPCLSNRLYNRIDNRLYRVNGVSVSVWRRWVTDCCRAGLQWQTAPQFELAESS